MKPHGSDFEYKNERNCDLMRAFHLLIGTVEQILLPHIYQRVVEMPSARFWVSEERAAIVIAAMMQGDKLERMRPNKREMFQEIFKRAMKLKQENPALTIYDLAFNVVRQPAPKFYLAPGYAKNIIFHVKKQWFEQRKKKLRHIF